jgi:hypothetical protein
VKNKTTLNQDAPLLLQRGMRLQGVNAELDGCRIFLQERILEGIEAENQSVQDSL